MNKFYSTYFSYFSQGITRCPLLHVIRFCMCNGSLESIYYRESFDIVSLNIVAYNAVAQYMILNVNISERYFITR